jgi:hypothetical protein
MICHNDVMATPSHPLSEASLRSALLARLSFSMGKNDLLIEELGVEHGSARIDVALASSVLTGYEIKSDYDTLDRLARQMHSYHRVFDTLTIVTTSTFVDQITALLPAWWGILIGEKTSEGGVGLKSYRQASSHTRQDARSIASLLWRDDAYSFAVEQLGSVVKPRATRDALYDLLAEQVPLEIIRQRVLATLRSRDDLRKRSTSYMLPEANCLTV